MYAVFPDAPSGRWLISDPAKGAFPVPFLAREVADDMCRLLNFAAHLRKEEHETAETIHRCRLGSALCEC